MRKLLRRVQLFAGEAEHIDIQGSRLMLSHGFRCHSHTVHYDHLILASGLSRRTLWLHFSGSVGIR